MWEREVVWERLRDAKCYPKTRLGTIIRFSSKADILSSSSSCSCTDLIISAFVGSRGGGKDKRKNEKSWEKNHLGLAWLKRLWLEFWEMNLIWEALH